MCVVYGLTSNKIVCAVAAAAAAAAVVVMEGYIPYGLFLHLAFSVWHLFSEVFFSLFIF